MNKNREKVTGAGFLRYLLGSDCCNQPSLFSWIASQTYKQRRDTADSPVESALLHHGVLGHGEQPTHRPQTLSESLGKSGWPCPRLLMEPWVHILQLLRHFPESLCWSVCSCWCLHPHASQIPRDGMCVLTSCGECTTGWSLWNLALRTASQ